VHVVSRPTRPVIHPFLPRRSALLCCLLGFGPLPPLPASAQGASAEESAGPATFPGCRIWELAAPPRDPTAAELRCRYGIRGPGRFGLSIYMDVPVYQPRTPLPGTHVVGVPGLPHPWPGESYEEWEWRIHRTPFGPEAHRAYRGLEVLDPGFASRLIEFEARLQEEGVSFRRRETWRSPERQAYLFQQGRSRPGPLITATLTSWHSMADERGRPFARAADYDVPRRQMPRFHEIAREVGLDSYGADSNDPGHVYLAGSESITGDALALLRLLPRVPYVTLSTGRPADEPRGTVSRAEMREAAAEWLSTPFLIQPQGPRLAGYPDPSPPRTEPLPPTPAPDLTIRRHAAGGVIPALLQRLRRR
jgi:hypothetical protein